MLKEKLQSPKFIGNVFLAIGLLTSLGLLTAIGRNIWIEATSTQLTGTIVEVESYRLGGGSSGRTYFSHTVDLSRNGQTTRYKAVEDLGRPLSNGSTPVLLTDDNKLYMHNRHAMYWSHLPKFLIMVPFIFIGLIIRRL